MFIGLGERNRRAIARAVEAERRRLARDLHDGALQELGWVRSALLRGATAAELLPAVDRAMAELREAIAANASAPDEPLAVALTRVVLEVGDRLGVPITLTLDEDGRGGAGGAGRAGWWRARGGHERGAAQRQPDSAGHPL